jgi:hypothetical protein
MAQPQQQPDPDAAYEMAAFDRLCELRPRLRKLLIETGEHCATLCEFLDDAWDEGAELDNIELHLRSRLDSMRRGMLR